MNSENATNDITIIGLIGKKRAGKDTFADYLVEKYGFIKLAFADPIKEVASLILNIDYHKIKEIDKEKILPDYDISLRQFYQIFGTELMRNEIYKYLPQLEKKIPRASIWIYNLLKKIENLKSKGYTKFVISDVRFNDEAQELYNNKGILVKILNEKAELNCDEHVSEKGINNISSKIIKYTIHNNYTLKDYYNTIMALMNDLGEIRQNTIS